MGHSERNKYNNKKVVIDNIKFDSLMESRRYLYLKRLLQAGEITKLEMQKPFSLKGYSGVVVCKYKADFTYYDKYSNFVVEDVKGVETAIFKLKSKLFESQFKLKINIIKNA